MYRSLVAKLFFLTFLVSNYIHGAQLPPWLSVLGYVQYEHRVSIDKQEYHLTTGNVVQNRVDLKWYPHNAITGALSIRSRFIYGPLIEQLQVLGYAEVLDTDRGAFDASWLIRDNASAILTSMLDRVYIDFSKGNLQVRLGRHRINWGKNLIWNPNDIFNVYSVFETSYPERPGTDALLIRYYTGVASNLDAVVSVSDKGDSVGGAVLWNMNQWGWDMQLIGGYKGEDVILGGGFSGQLKGAALRGEGTFFQPDTSSDLTDGVFVGSISSDYVFSFQLYVHGSMLYKSNGNRKKTTAAATLDPFASISAKNLTQSRLNLFFQTQYPVTPLFSVDLSVILNPYDGSAVFMPRSDLSLTENLELYLQGQLFTGEVGDEYGMNENLVYGSLRWSF